MEWSGALYLALNCRKSDRNNKLYPECVLEFVEVDGKICWIKLFNHKRQSLDRLSLITKPWKATDRVVDKVLKKFNEVPPS